MSSESRAAAAFASELDAIDDYVGRQAEGGGPSLAISIVKDGRLVKEAAYGYAKRYGTAADSEGIRPAAVLDKDDWEAATPQTMYDLASNTKMYATNYAIQRLVTQGRLDLDRTVQSFPGWEAFTDASTLYTGDWTIGGVGGIADRHTGKATITIADLLHHTGGLIPDPAYHDRTVAGGLHFQSHDVSDRTGIVDVICKTPLMAAPRTLFRYSDVDYMILGLIVEQLTGQRLDAYLHDEFYGPLGLTRTVFTPLQHGFRAQDAAATELNGNTRDGAVDFGAFADGTPVPIRRHTLQGEVHDEKAYYSMGGVSGHAGLFSTVGEMAVLTQLMLSGGSFEGRQYFSRDVAARFTTPFALDSAHLDGSTIGLGWRLRARSGPGYSFFDRGPSRGTYGHHGWSGTLTVIDPAYNLAVTVLTNMRHCPVVEPPNGFASRAYPISSLVPVVERVYAALNAAGAHRPGAHRPGAQ